jgi:hypothetical protein
MVLQQRQHKSTDGMTSKIRRHISQFQPPPGRDIVRMSANELSQRFGVAIVPFAMLRGNRRRVVAGMIMKPKKQVAAKPGIGAVEFYRLTVSRDRLIEQSLIFQDTSQRIVRLGIIRPQR